ncbi:hypothetical protein CO614_01780 [Lysobacteraceae bacterium NML120232]|nr:hypothetical protein CO614_01780 [Xanthomonadaceae bacterium NML120232]
MQGQNAYKAWRLAKYFQRSKRGFFRKHDRNRACRQALKANKRKHLSEKLPARAGAPAQGT